MRAIPEAQDARRPTQDLELDPGCRELAFVMVARVVQEHDGLSLGHLGPGEAATGRLT